LNTSVNLGHHRQNKSVGLYTIFVILYIYYLTLTHTYEENSQKEEQTGSNEEGYT